MSHSRSDLILMGAITLVFTLARNHATYEVPGLTVADLAAFRAVAPFNHRFLVPLLSSGLAEGLDQVGISAGLRQVADVINVFSFALCLLAIRPLFAILGNARFSYVGYCLFGYIMLPNYVNALPPYNIWYPYDIPAVAFFLWATVFALQRRIAAFYAVFCIGLLNRETMAFAVFLYWAGWGLTQRRDWMHIGALVALTVATKLMIAATLTDAPGGGAFYDQLAHNLSTLATAAGWLRLLTAFGGAWFFLFGLPYAADARLRALGWLLVSFLAAAVAGGDILELRLYSELVAVILVALSYHLSAIAKRP